MIKLAVTGCLGRMGRRIAELASLNKDFQITALIERPDCPEVPEILYGVKVARDADAIKGSDVLIDFSSPAATLINLDACLRHRVRMVVGTTGLTAEQDQSILEASRRLGIVRSSNMSVGVNVLFGVLRKMAQALNGYSVSIEETHHIHKKDAPSGTAKTMADIVENFSAAQLQNVPIISSREGEVIGYHKVIFNSLIDTIEITHNAKTRDMFAQGALVAAKFVAYKDNGLFSMQDVLGLV